MNRSGFHFPMSFGSSHNSIRIQQGRYAWVLDFFAQYSCNVMQRSDVQNFLHWNSLVFGQEWSSELTITLCRCKSTIWMHRGEYLCNSEPYRDLHEVLILTRQQKNHTNLMVVDFLGGLCVNYHIVYWCIVNLVCVYSACPLLLPWRRQYWCCARSGRRVEASYS